MKKANFIRTSDEETKDKLLSLGFNLISFENGMYLFENNNPLSFESANGKVVYTNLLTF